MFVCLLFFFCLLIHILAVCFRVKCLAAINRVPVAHQLSRRANFHSGKRARAAGEGTGRWKPQSKWGPLRWSLKFGGTCEKIFLKAFLSNGFSRPFHLSVNPFIYNDKSQIYMYLTALPADRVESKSLSPWGPHFEPYMKIDGASGLKKEGKGEVQKKQHPLTPFILEGTVWKGCKKTQKLESRAFTNS